MAKSFADDVAAWSLKTKKNANKIVRAVALEVLRRVVLRSPVGNPELWAINAERANAIHGGMSIRKANSTFGLHAPKGYVGGRFRGNWQVSIGEPITDELPRIDPNGALTIAAGSSVLKDAPAGIPIFIVNNLPYAQRLEYGWSKQAPAGMVRVTVAELSDIVKSVGVDLRSNQ